LKQPEKSLWKEQEDFEEEPLGFDDDRL